MSEQMQAELRAYFWTLAALVFVYFGTLIAAALAPDVISKLEAFGLGTITGGLIGLLRMPRHAPPPPPPGDATGGGAAP